jgi:dTDP-4-dehydrorhamnose 3,5-epimerase
MIKVKKAFSNGVVLFETTIYNDNRGFFFESWKKDQFNFDTSINFVQDNFSFSNKNVFRGFHFQHPDYQAKLVRVLEGEIIDIIVDLRLDRDSFGSHQSFMLNSSNNLSLYVPEGFAHGFLVTSNQALVSYKVTADYNPDNEHTLLFNDKEIFIDSLINKKNLIVSDKDSNGLTLLQVKELFLS